MTNARLAPGTFVGHLRVMGKVHDDMQTTSPNLKKRCVVDCVCGKRETIPEYYLTRKKPKTHCGCMAKSNKTHFNQEYRIWHMMHVRCYDKRHEAYKHYGGRGIGVCPEWHKDSEDGEGFTRFLAYIGPRPSPGHSIDRVDNDDGYKPFQKDGVTRQVRWATADVQRANQRVKT